jgi:hypothetical protein
MLNNLTFKEMRIVIHNSNGFFKLFRYTGTIWFGVLRKKVGCDKRSFLASVTAFFSGHFALRFAQCFKAISNTEMGWKQFAVTDARNERLSHPRKKVVSQFHISYKMDPNFKP